MFLQIDLYGLSLSLTQKFLNYVMKIFAALAWYWNDVFFGQKWFVDFHENTNIVQTQRDKRKYALQKPLMLPRFNIQNAVYHLYFWKVQI